MEKEKNKKSKSDNSNIGKTLVDCLTKEQLALLLDIAVDFGDISKHNEKIREFSPDLSKTIERVLSLRTNKIEPLPVLPQLASDEKNLEHWSSLWDKWESIVSEVGDEEGEYVTQDAHWEAPYFDGYTLAEDLDKIGKEMLPLVEQIYALNKQPELFSEAIEELNSYISSYPDWMGSSEGCSLGQKVSGSVLKWFWLNVQKDNQLGTNLFNKVYELEKKSKNVYLDEEATVAFFSELPGTVCREIYEHLKSPEFEKSVNYIYSTWHKINHIYESRFDSTRYLETCNKYLPENWRYGLPLVEEAIVQKDFKKADSLLQNIFLSFFDRKENNVWYPETSLLLAEERYSHEEDKDKIVKLLEFWGKVSENNSNKIRSAAAKIQSVIYSTPEDWDRIISEYNELKHPFVKEILDSLFLQWQTEIAERSVQSRLNKNISTDTWIHWLIEAKLEVTDRKTKFLKKLDRWLEELKKDVKLFKQQWVLLSQLTKDLSFCHRLQNLYPSFFKVVLPAASKTSKLDEVRCKELKELNIGSCLTEIIAVWKTHLYSIVPDPSNSYNSKYREYAEWMKALYELNREGYNNLLSKWHKTHKNRRNLWLELKSQQLTL